MTESPADWLRNNSHNSTTPNDLKERFGLTTEEVRQICTDNDDITVLMVVRKPPAPKLVEPGLKPSWSVGQLCERMSVKNLIGIMTRSFEGNLRNMIATMGDMMVSADVPECHVDIPTDICKLSWQDYPDFHARLSMVKTAGSYKFKIDGEWDCED